MYKRQVYKMIHDKRIGYYAAADYTDGSDMDKLLKSVIDVVAAQDKMCIRDRCHSEIIGVAYSALSFFIYVSIMPDS